MTPRHGGLVGNHGSMTPPAILAEPRSRVSERSESGYGSARLGSTSIQELDFLHAGTELVPESDSGFYSHPSLESESSIEQDASFTHAQLQHSFHDSTHFVTPTWPDGSIDDDVVPWYPGARVWHLHPRTQ